ncbi:MAG: ABC transporter permease [Actinomycetota bacterium]|nr:ABC transporter permease [Actinomycetota bacterium]
MPGSIPASGTADLQVTLGQPLELTRRRVVLHRFLRHPAGMAGLVMTLVLVGLGLFADTVAPGDPFAYAGTPLEGPTDGHLFGTDNLGRDVARAIVHGLQTSAVVVLWVVLIATAIGVVLGAVSGYVGGFVDDVLQRFTELFQSIPRFFLVLLVLALFGSGFHNMILVLGLTSWPTLARVVRAECLSLREREFVEAARSLGASSTRILVRHILPNVVPAAIVVIALLASRIILLEASLSFLGLGDPNVMSLGFLVANAQRFIRIAWWMSVFPGAALGLAVLAVNLLGDGLNDMLTPTR